MKRLALATLSFLLVLAATYAGIWFWTAQRFHRIVERSFENAAADGVIVKAQALDVTGFPGPFTVNFSGSVENEGVTFVIPALSVRSFFMVPGARLTADMPQGFSIPGASLPFDPSTQSYHLEARLPYTWPENYTKAAMAAWQTGGNTIILNEFTSKDRATDALHLRTYGSFTLDADLQPQITLNIESPHLDTAPEYLQKQGIISENALPLARAALTTLMAAGQDGKASYLPIAIKQRRLFVGPLALAPVQEIVWPALAEPLPTAVPEPVSDSPPVPHQ